MLSKICVKNPYIMIVGVLIILILSMEGFRNIEIESLPATDAPCIAITTLYEQAGPETVEQKVTKEIENAISSVQNVEHIRSISQTGISTVVLELSKGTDIDTAVMEIRGRIEQAREVLPDSTSKPNILKMDSEAAPVIVAAIDQLLLIRAVCHRNLHRKQRFALPRTISRHMCSILCARHRSCPML